MPKLIQDKYGRSLKVLRLSLTQKCNFQCLYCAPTLKDKKLVQELWEKPAKYINNIRRIHLINPLDVVRLTGGEPSLYPYLAELIYELKKIGIPKISMTSNGMKLANIIIELKEAGLDSINISIDSLKPEVMRSISRHPHAEKALESIDLCKNIGLKLKVNCTLWKGINNEEIVTMLAYFGKQNVPLRYLELMNMGHLYGKYKDYLYLQDDILRDLGKHYSFVKLKREESATAQYWQTKEKWIFGIIANHSTPFCRDCNRLRMDSKGELYGCLSNSKSIPIADEAEGLERTLRIALAQKQSLQFKGSKLSMQSIGG